MEGEKPSDWAPSSEPEEAVATKANGRRRIGVGSNVSGVRRREQKARSSVAFDAILLLLLLAVAEPTPREYLMFQKRRKESGER